MMPMPDFLIFSYITIFVNSVFLGVVAFCCWEVRNVRKYIETLFRNPPKFKRVNDEIPQFEDSGDRIAPKYIDDATAARLERDQIINNREKGR